MWIVLISFKQKFLNSVAKMCNQCKLRRVYLNETVQSMWGAYNHLNGGCVCFQHVDKINAPILLIQEEGSLYASYLFVNSVFSVFCL